MKKPAHQRRFFLLLMSPNLVQLATPMLVAALRPRLANELPDVDVMNVVRTKLNVGTSARSVMIINDRRRYAFTGNSQAQSQMLNSLSQPT